MKCGLGGFPHEQLYQEAIALFLLNNVSFA